MFWWRRPLFVFVFYFFILFLWAFRVIGEDRTDTQTPKCASRKCSAPKNSCRSPQREGKHEINENLIFVLRDACLPMWRRLSHTHTRVRLNKLYVVLVPSFRFFFFLFCAFQRNVFQEFDLVRRRLRTWSKVDTARLAKDERWQAERRRIWKRTATDRAKCMQTRKNRWSFGMRLHRSQWSACAHLRLCAAAALVRPAVRFYDSANDATSVHHRNSLELIIFLQSTLHSLQCRFLISNEIFIGRMPQRIISCTKNREIFRSCRSSQSGARI